MSPLLLLAAAGGWHGPFPSQGSPQISYSLKTEPYKNEPGARIRLDGGTVYTLFEKYGETSRELWRITLPERPIHTWVSLKGDVWVIADTTNLAGGPMGGRSTLWARRNDADVIGSWSGEALLTGVRDKGSFGMVSQLDASHSEVSSIGGSGSEQFKLALKNGAEVLVTTVQTRNQGVVNVVQRFAKGQGQDDPLQHLLTISHVPVDVSEPVPETLPVRVWQSPSSTGQCVLEVRSSEDVVASDHWIAAPPRYVTQTPLGQYAWFEFTPTNVTLRFLNYDGKEMQAVDLVKLGKFHSAAEAEAQLNYRSMRAVESSISGASAQTFTMTDELGRRYAIFLKAAKDGTLSVTSAVSLGLDRVAKKQPDYPDAKLESETDVKSDNGQYKLTAQHYVQSGRTFTQLTLSAKIDDPIEGPKEVQVWSEPAPLEPLQLRLSDSGRAYGIMLMPKPAKMPKTGGGAFAMLFCWDVDGKLSAGYDLAGLALKWFPSDTAAIKEMDLSKLKFSLAGQTTEREVDGIPLQTWPKERLDYTLGNGKTQTLFVSTQAGFGMPIFTPKL
ncbi:MAG TPA: hypothetical protein VHE55_08835 [Fimbriimonadaceae bacterium]|nr:hypothetical protein [Fimbriimonadaceae bacterium]